MPRLRNAKHEKLAQTYVKEKTKDPETTQAEVYSKVYRNASPISARSYGSVLLNNPQIAGRIQEIINQHNSDEDCSKDLAELRKATKQVFDPEGNLVEVKDNVARANALQMAFKAKQAFQESVTTIDNRQITFNQGQTKEESGMYLDSLSNAIERLTQLNNKLNTEQKD